MKMHLDLRRIYILRISERKEQPMTSQVKGRESFSHDQVQSSEVNSISRKDFKLKASLRILAVL